MKKTASFLLLFCSLPSWIPAAESIVPLRSRRSEQTVVVDGVLDDPVWQRSADLSQPLITSSPAYGTILDQDTQLWLAHDQDQLYFALRAFDRQPGLIKTSVTKRDNIENDDWVAISLDAMGGRQSAIVFKVNPSGIQADLHETPSGSDLSPDYVWSSAAVRTATGYDVEIAIPLKSIRFNSGRNVAVNLLLMRQIARQGSKACWPAKTPAQSYLAVHHPVIYDELARISRLELIPAFTVGAWWDRLSRDDWSPTSTDPAFGLTGKWGITSSIFAEATINPDFSQVETDDFQVLVNQRYPIFYQEKRPFFMETSALFNLAASDDSGDYNMYTAVHTRSIVDPVWGAKLSGELRRLSFGVLVARDELPMAESTDLATVVLGRLKWNLGADNYGGLLYSGRGSDLDRNDALAFDFSYKLSGGHHLSAKAIFSSSRQGEGQRVDDWSLTGSWGYYSKPLSAFLVGEHVGKDFRMDSAFMLRGGISRVMGYIAPSVYPAGLNWLKRLNLMLWGYQVHDYTSGADDALGFIAFRAFFSKQASLRLDWRHFREEWAGVKLSGRYFFFGGQWQVSNPLFIYISLEAGDKILYDASNPLVGDGLSGQVVALLQPSEKLAFELSCLYERLNQPRSGDRLYDVQILRSKSTYQLNRYLYLRALIQYDSSQRRILSDILASFTLIPETVVHLGYGSLHERTDWTGSGDAPMLQADRLYQVKQSLFFKASYRLRL